ncbi:MAG: DUF951 domain-containing protein [Firmicutes bacterium]|nr:DUF951 domain-containing protein [Bacillota bacterium]
MARLKKPHACGATDWLVLRMGMDVYLQCSGCGRELKLKRHDLEKRLQKRLPQPPQN